jgi:hypothetical protein
LSWISSYYSYRTIKAGTFIKHKLLCSIISSYPEVAGSFLETPVASLCVDIIVDNGYSHPYILLLIYVAYKLWWLPSLQCGFVFSYCSKKL